MRSNDPVSHSNKMLRFVAEFSGGRPLPSLHLHDMFAALRHRNYRLWFMGQLVSLVGTWMQTAAQAFLIFELTHSPAYLGYVGFATGAPSCLLMLFGGVFADCISRRKLLLITQSVMMILSFILASLALLHIVQPWHILLLALGVGVTNAFDAPARQSFVLEMVKRKDLMNAIALNSMMFNMGTILGPAAAGITYALMGPGWCFAINGVTFFAVILALVKMRLKPFVTKPRTTAPLEEFKEGLRYAASHEVIRTLLKLAAVTSFFGMVYMTLIPAWAVKVLGGGAATNGWLLSARGIGALGGAMMIAALGRFKYKGRLLTIGMFIFPVMLLIFSEVRGLSFSLLALIGIGWGHMMMFNTLNGLIQSLVADELRGRVVSIYMMCIFGLIPIGALMGGWVAESFGEPTAVLLSAGVSLSYAIWIFFRVPLLRSQTG